MSTSTLDLSVSRGYSAVSTKKSLFARFFAWCDAQQPNRLLWLGIILAAHGCLLTPLTVIAVVLGGVNIVLFGLAVMAMSANLIVNLAAMPTKITLPVLFASVLLDIVIVAITAFMGFDASIAF